jgi:hypothetical protein
MPESWEPGNMCGSQHQKTILVSHNKKAYFAGGSGLPCEKSNMEMENPSFEYRCVSH